MHKRWTIAAVLAAMTVATGLALAAENTQAEKTITTLEEVESTMIKEAGYDEATQVLTVKFVNGDEIYEYKNVPKSVYDELMAAESKGSYFAKNIKGKYEFEKK